MESCSQLSFSLPRTFVFRDGHSSFNIGVKFLPLARFRSGVVEAELRHTYYEREFIREIVSLLAIQIVAPSLFPSLSLLWEARQAAIVISNLRT